MFSKDTEKKLKYRLFMKPVSHTNILPKYLLEEQKYLDSSFSTDITQSYLKGAESLQLGTFINTQKYFNLKPDQFIKLLKPLYYIAESGDYL